MGIFDYLLKNPPSGLVRRSLFPTGISRQIKLLIVGNWDSVIGRMFLLNALLMDVIMMQLANGASFILTCNNRRIFGRRHENIQRRTWQGPYLRHRGNMLQHHLSLEQP